MRASWLNPLRLRTTQLAIISLAVVAIPAQSISISQQAYLKSSRPAPRNNFGGAVAVSLDIAVVGEEWESTGGSGRGAAYVFRRSGGQWRHAADLRSSNPTSFSYFGHSVAVFGNTVVIGQPNTRGGGAAHVYIRSGSLFVLQQVLKGSNTVGGDGFGDSVGISGDTIVVGAEGRSGNAGAAYVFVRSGTKWSQLAFLRASNAESGDSFGWASAISGGTIVIGAPGEGSAGGICHPGCRSQNDKPGAGAAYVFVRRGGSFVEQGLLKAHNANQFDRFGWKVDIAGGTVVVGAYGQDSVAVGAGAAYVFERIGTTWEETAFLKPRYPVRHDEFGYSVAAATASTVVIGARFEKSYSVGVNGVQNNRSLIHPGAAFVFTRATSGWQQTS